MALNTASAVLSLVPYRLAPSLALPYPWSANCSSCGSCKGSSFSSFPRRSLLGSLAFHSVMFASSSSVAARSKLSEAEQILKNVDWPQQFPFKKEDFQRYDESQDTIFYSSPRFVTHIDDSAIQALTKHYASVFPPSNSPGIAILDMCSSWISHYPKGYKQERIAGLGLNAEELKRNPVLTEYAVQDLNQTTTLPYEDNAFDVITNAVSVDYLAKPLEIFKEMRRVLKPAFPIDAFGQKQSQYGRELEILIMCTLSVLISITLGAMNHHRLSIFLQIQDEQTQCTSSFHGSCRHSLCLSTIQ